MHEHAGTVFYEGLFGKTGAEPDAVAMQMDTVMWVASCTKVTNHEAPSAFSRSENAEISLTQSDLLLASHLYCSPTVCGKRAVRTRRPNFRKTP